MITKPLLAATIKPEEIDKLRYPLLASPKLDGIRALRVGDQLLSRTFKPIPNKHIQYHLSNILPEGVDGELMLQNRNATFQEITSAVMSHDGAPKIRYCVFDWVHSEFGPSEEFMHRYKACEDIICDEIYQEEGIEIEIVRHVILPTEAALIEYEEECLRKGYEGVMLRDPLGGYKSGRSTLKEGILIKLKRFEDAEAEILGFEERYKNTNIQEVSELGYAKRSSAKAGMVGAGTLGAFLVRDIETKIEFSIGSGLDDSLRAKIWKDKDSYIGKVIKYKSLKIGVLEKPRHPVFLGFRHEADYDRSYS